MTHVETFALEMRGEVFTTLVWKYVSLSSSYTKGCQSRQVSQSLRLSSSHMISHLGSSIKSRSPIPSSIIVKLGTTLLCEQWAKNGDLESGERTPGENRSLLLVIQHSCDTKFEYNGTIKYFLSKNSNCLDLLPWSSEAKKKRGSEFEKVWLNMGTRLMWLKIESIKIHRATNLLCVLIHDFCPCSNCG